MAKAGIETEVFQVGGRPLRGCTACGLCKEQQDSRCSMTGDALNDCLAKMIAADGVLIGSPTYFADVTSETKALIDRAGYVSRACGHLLRRKVGAAVVAVRRAGAIHAFDTINHFFTISQMIIPGSSYWNIGVGREQGDVDGDPEGLETMTCLGENMAWLLGKLHGGQL
jgi:multimeric flavodoxin WrbA